MANLGQMLVSNLLIVAMHMHCRAAGVSGPKLGAAIGPSRWARPPGHAGPAASIMITIIIKMWPAPHAQYAKGHLQAHS